MESITMYAVIFTGDDEMTTEHTAYATEEDAAKAGAALARRVWVEYGERDEEEDLSFPEVDNDWDAMDMLRGGYNVSLEVEPIEVSADVIRALHAKL